MEPRHLAAIVVGIGALLFSTIMIIGAVIARNQFRYESFNKTRYENMLKMHMVDHHNQVMSDLSDIFTRYLLLRKGNYHDTGIVIEAMTGTVKGQLESIIAHFNHELTNFELYDQIKGLAFVPDVTAHIQSDRVAFTLNRTNGSDLQFTLCNPNYFGPMLAAELDQYRSKMGCRVYTRSHRKFESLPQTYLTMVGAGFGKGAR